MIDSRLKESQLCCSKYPV